MKQDNINNTNENLRLKAEAIAKDIQLLENTDVDMRWREVEQRIDAKESRNRRYLFFMKAASVLVLPLLISSLLFAYMLFVKQEKQDTIGFAEITAPSCAVLAYELPDQTKVWLNGNSTLKYPTKFIGNKRVVELNGEANFEVKANPECPFYVKTPEGLVVYVYGTKFNLSAYQDDEYIQAVLEHGKVNVILPNRENEVKLLPGEQLSYSKQLKQSVKKKVNIKEFIAWVEGKIIFRDTPLKMVVKRLSRFYNLDIELRNHRNKEYELRATFKRQPIHQILEYMSYSIPLRWKTIEQKQLPDGTIQKKKIILDIF